MGPEDNEDIDVLDAEFDAGELEIEEAEERDDTDGDPFDLTSNETALSTMRAVAPETAEALHTAWRGDLAANLKFAQAAFNEYATPALVEQFEANGLGNHPDVIKAMASVGRRIAAIEGNPASVGRETKSVEPEDTRSREEQYEAFEALISEQTQALERGDRQKALRMEKEVRALAEKLTSNEPIVGRGGRTA